MPADVDYVCNFAVVKSEPLGCRPRGQRRGRGPADGALPRRARAFLHCSSTGVYEAADGAPQLETDPLGDNHRVMMPTYSISKIAAEAVVRTTCRIFDVPTTIARLNVPYGDNGGWPAFHLAMMLAGQPVPVHPIGPNRFNPIHEDDIIAMLPALLDRGDRAGDDRQLGRRRGDEHRGVVRVHRPSSPGAKRASTSPTHTIGGIPTDNTKRLELAGPTTVSWKDGMRRMVEQRLATST